MGGKQSSEIIKPDIINAIDTEITNLTKNVTKLLNETITKTTMSVVNTNSQQIEQTTAGGNIFTAGNLILKNSTFDVNQSVSIKSVNTAIANMTQDASAMADLATKINSAVIDKVINDSTMQQSLQSLSNLQNAKSTAGGLNDMINNVTTMIGDVLKPGDTMTTEKYGNITNQTIAKLSNTTLNENNIKSIITNNITNSISQLNSGICKIQTTGFNEINYNNIELENSTFKQGQVYNVDALNNCVLGASQISKLVTDITTGFGVSVTNESSNKAIVRDSLNTHTDESKVVSTGDAFGKMISSFNPFNMFSSESQSSLMAACCCCCCCIIIMILMMIPYMIKMKNNDA